ncbi:MAG: hypothetical protein FJX76_14965 [Armatimonadetes bacterium]|nr:hypothetical protein [Armatimonadota bacterium]
MMPWIWLALALLSLLAGYAFAVWRVYRGFPTVRVRLGDERVEVAPVARADGFVRQDMKRGSLLVPSGVGQKKVAEEGERSRVSWKDRAKVASVQVTVLPRRESSLHFFALPWAKPDGFKVLERALRAKFSFMGVVMRSVLVKGQTDVSFARVDLGPLHGFLRRGFQHFQGEPRSGARVHQFDLFDAEHHYKIDFLSFHEALTDEQVLTSLASFIPPR